MASLNVSKVAIQLILAQYAQCTKLQAVSSAKFEPPGRPEHT